MSPVQEVPRPSGSSAVRHDEIPPRTPTPGGSVAGPEFDEPLTITDAAIMGFAKDEPLVMADAAVMGFSKNEGLLLPDGYSMLDLPVYNDTVLLDDAFTLTAANLIVGRSGTPDTDRMSDAWTDEAASTVNHGNESLQVRPVSTVPNNDSKAAWVQIDLTGVTGVTAGAAGASLAIIASTSNGLLATTLNFVAFAAQAARWFTESTLTWNTQPAPAWTQIANLVVAPGAAATYTLTFTQAQLNTMIGKWVLVGISTNAAAVAPDTVTILSRDNATASNRPKFTANYKLP